MYGLDRVHFRIGIWEKAYIVTFPVYPHTKNAVLSEVDVLIIQHLLL
jgi:hypothetical protein